MKKTMYIGLDVHKNSIMLSRIIGQSNRSEEVQLAHDPRILLKRLKDLKKRYELRVCYEAGGCGYGIYRLLKKSGIDCVVVAPSLIPFDGKRVKTDRKISEVVSTLRGPLKWQRKGDWIEIECVVPEAIDVVILR